MIQVYNESTGKWETIHVKSNPRLSEEEQANIIRQTRRLVRVVSDKQKDKMKAEG